jgi:hypothetical protein
MANEEHLAIIRQGVSVWNKWREGNPEVVPDLSRTEFHQVDIYGADLAGVNLEGTILYGTFLFGTNLHGANLTAVKLDGADLSWAKLSDATLVNASLVQANLLGANLQSANLDSADLSGANLNVANFSKANLSNARLSAASLGSTILREANLHGADLQYAGLVETDLTKAILVNCLVYGISVWGVKLEDTVQSGLVITHHSEHTITVENLELAQFIYLLLNNKKIRDVIDTITSKVVLILGRFTPERIAILNAIRNELRKHNYSPVLFEFDKPVTRDLTETISTLAHLSRFIIADITDPRSIPQELQAIVPNLPSVPIQPLLLSSQHEYGMFEHFIRYPWVLPIQHYDRVDDLLASLGDKVIAPAEAKAKELYK